jgi:hypothetical protein
LREESHLLGRGAAEQLGNCTLVTVSTAFPHFLYLYGLSPNAEPSKTIWAPGCTNTGGIVVVVVGVGLSVNFASTLLAALLISSGGTATRTASLSSTQLVGSHGNSSRQAGHCSTETVSTASPHFLQRYGPSPDAEPSKIAFAPWCENAAVELLLLVLVPCSLPCYL